MKKFLAVVLVVVAVSGLVLFMGWAQRGVPPDSVGVLRTKSHGTDPDLVVPGGFRWAWQRLIPTNSRVSVFRLGPVQRRFRASGELPSGRVFAAFLGIREDFSWELDAALSFSLRPEVLVSLAEAENMAGQEDLDGYLDGLSAEIGAFAVRWFDMGGAESVARADDLVRVGGIPALSAEVERRFPAVADFSLSVNSARFPDFAMYELARERHGEFVALQGRRIADALAEMTAERVGAFGRIAELELYGDLLTRFPILLEYLSIEGGGGRSGTE